MVVLSSWLDRKNVVLGEWREEIDVIKSLSLTDLAQNRDLRNRGWDIIHCLQDPSNTFEDLASTTKLQLLDVESICRKIGLASLPDEVLAIIFEFAANGTGNEDPDRLDWKFATILSHVCQHFRAVITSCPQFWTDMRGNVEKVETHMSRSGNLPLTVDLTIYCDPETADWHSDPNFDVLTPHLGRWRSLYITFHHTYDSSIWTQRHSGYHRSKGQRLLLVDAPLLQDLHLTASAESSFNGGVRSHWDWTRWSTPNLQNLECRYFFPLCLPGLSNLISLIVLLDVNDEWMYETVEKIAGMHRLRDLTIQLSNTSDDDSVEIIPPHKLHFPSIRQLVINTQLHIPDEFHNPAHLRALFSSLFFPGVTHLYIHIESNAAVGDADFGWDRDYCNIYFNDEVSYIFRRKDQFPRVTTLELDLDSSLGDYHSSDGHSEVWIPLEMLPNLQHLTIRCNTRFYVKDPEFADQLLLEGEEVVPREVGDSFPALKTVTLDLFDSSVVTTWLEEYLKRLKGIDGGDAFRQLVLIIDGVSFIGEEALSWCSVATREEQPSMQNLENASSAQ